MRYTPDNFDWLNPSYVPVWKKRVEFLEKLKADPVLLHACKLHYKYHVADFISDWGVTLDPRNAGSGRPILMPFILFPRQRELIEFIIDRWRAQETGIVVKSRDCGASWLAMAASVSLALFWNNVSFGFGSAKEDKVDKSNDPDCLFYKGRMFAKYLPAIFKGGWNERKNSAHMILDFPLTESSITGEAGDNIGAGGRKTIYFLDEFALVERPKLVMASLTSNNRCRIEMSTVRGIANVFADHARSGLIKRFDFHYRDDPRKTDLVTHELHPWFAKEKADAQELDLAIWNQEYEADFLASIEGGVIEHIWIAAALGALEKLGLQSTGKWTASFDVADQGTDKNAVAIRHGTRLVYCEQWSGQNSDPMESIRRAFEIADRYNALDLIYDASGMGGSWHKYFDMVNDERLLHKQKPIELRPFQGGGAVLDPELMAEGTKRKNLDYFENLKAQCWMMLRMRFVETYRAVVKGGKYNPENIISIDRGMKLESQLLSELAQPTRKWSKNGKLMIDKTPDGVASPNVADAIMQAFGYYRAPLTVSDEVMAII
jgi:phage terminase large subunit